MSLPVITSIKKVKIGGTNYIEHPYTNSNVVEVVGAQGTDKSLTTKLGEIATALASKEPKNTNIQSHISDKANPHGVTKDQVGLGNVDNTTDAMKPISSATQLALDNKVDKNSTDRLMTASEGTKLAGIATGAQVNPTIATKAEAEAGTDNTKMMTPSRVKEAINKLSPPPAAASATVAGVVKITNDYAPTTPAEDTALSQKGAKLLKEALELLTSVGAKPKPPVAYAFAENLQISSNKITFGSLGGEQLILSDDILINDRLLLKGQTLSTANGVYLVTAKSGSDITVSKYDDSVIPLGSLVFVDKGKFNDHQFYRNDTNSWILFARPDTIAPGSGLESNGLEMGIKKIFHYNINDAPRQYDEAMDYIDYQRLVEALAYEIKKIKGTDAAFDEDESKTLDSKQSKITYTTNQNLNPANDGDIVVYYML